MMWDFTGGRRSPTPNHMPNPSFPVPVHSTPSYTHSNGSSYPPLPIYGSSGVPSTSHSEAYDLYQAPRAVPFPSTSYYQTTQQSAAIHHSTHHTHHSNHSGHRSRRHSHTPTTSLASIPMVPQVPIYSSTTYPKPTLVHHSSSQHLSAPNRTSHSQSQAIVQPAPKKHSSRSRSHSHSHPRHDDSCYSTCTGRKKAVCIGINYRGQSNALRGCVNDAKRVREFLINQGGYRPENIVLLTDESNDPRSLPTRKNIIACMKWLVRNARENDALFFHYSGHGGQTPDQDGDEIDGFDEVIFPLDFKKNGHITDDEMHELMVKDLPDRCRLTGLFDACHSGTVLDLPYIYSSHGRLKGSHVSARARARRRSTHADVISWSGCKDGQTSADTFHGGVAVGAMSHAFVSSLRDKPHQSYQELLRSVRLILHPRYSQKPQLGSSHHIDTNLRFVF